MNSIFFVSITICLQLLIGSCWSQLSGFPQPKAIRDNSGFFRQEIFYPGLSGNTVIQHPQAIAPQKPVHVPLHHSGQLHHIPAPIPQPSLTPIPEPENIPERPIDTTIVRSAPNRQFVAFPQPPPLATSTSPIPLPSTTPRITTTTEPATSEELEEQARSAYYKFGTSVHDSINDHEHVRQEVREGLALKGMYSYSDGFFRRTVHYEADEDGYRVTKEEIEALGDGPQFNPKGQAVVKNSMAGDYSIGINDFRLNKKQEDFIDGN